MNDDTNESTLLVIKKNRVVFGETTELQCLFVDVIRKAYFVIRMHLLWRLGEFIR